MSASLKDIERQARMLTAEERAKLAESLLESLHSPISEVEAAWVQEIEQRVAAFDRGEMTGVSSKGPYCMSRTKVTQMAMSNQWLKEQGLVSIKELWSRFHYPASTA